MTTLTRIGNSQGVRIPKTIVKQANLENADIEFEITKDGLLLKPKPHKTRYGWKKAIEEALHTKGIEEVNEFVDVDLDVKDWEW